MTGETYRTGQATTPHSREADDELAGRRVLPRPRRQRRASRVGRLCLAAVLSTVSASALADPSVFVNENLLDGITQQGVPVLPYNAQSTYGGQPGFAPGGASTTIVGTNPDGSQYYVTRPSTLLFPPPRFPRSRVTVIDSGTASGGGTSYSFNTPAPSGGVATQSAARLAQPSPTSGQKAESRLLVPLPPSISQQAAAPKAPAAKSRPAPQPPKQVAKAKAPEPPKVPAPPKKTVAAPKTVAAAPAPKAPAAKAPAPKAVAAPPPPKIVPKQLAETSAPSAASLAATPSSKAPATRQLTDTTASLTPPPPPPPVTPKGSAAAAQPQQQAAAPKAPQDPAPSQQSASRGDATAQVSEVQVLFGSNEAALSGAAKSALENVAQSMLENEASEIQLFAYAGQTGIDATQARRLSLSRAMAVRAFLIGKGIRPARMQVRALGNKTTSGSPDRVDVVPAKR